MASKAGLGVERMVATAISAGRLEAADRLAD